MNGALEAGGILELGEHIGPVNPQEHLNHLWHICDPRKPIAQPVAEKVAIVGMGVGHGGGDHEEEYGLARFVDVEVEWLLAALRKRP